MSSNQLRILAVALAVAASPVSGQAQEPDCANAQQSCGAILQQDCLSRMGAGSMAIPDATGDDCSAQMTAYRECLTNMVEQCPSIRQAQPTEDEGSLEALAESLGRLGGLIEAPATPVEYYNNALVYARRGDALSSRRMYEKAIVGGVDAVDVHQRYSQLVKAQEGLIGAREVYGDLARRLADNRSAQLANALIQPANQREAALRALVTGDDPFAPAYFEIANLYSADRLGAQSIDDKRAEKAALEAFDAADQSGKVYRWFLEKEMVEIWRESVRRRLAAYRTQVLDVPPVTLSAMASNDSWLVNLLMAEPAQAIRYRIDDGEVVSTGALEAIDQRTGRPMPRPFFNLPLGVETASIDVWYDDIRGVERGPYPVSFDARASFATNTRNVFENITTKWVQDSEYDGRHLIYFTHLLSFRCGLTQIEYGVDRDTPDQVYPMPPCDPKDPHSVRDAEIYLEFEQRVSKVVIQLTYADGETTPARVFEF
ncbi:MAG: hypothetical protein KTR21_00315 [Rhodobacteraceae bacterium]|nr:hypothetical protein [Paracoccaceae bacterium]